jgi:hypothetical protein
MGVKAIKASKGEPLRSSLIMLSPVDVMRMGTDCPTMLLFQPDGLGGYLPLF